MSGTLYLVATPIGNLQDITHRAAAVLRSVDVIACEDTRHTQKLLNHLGIVKKLVSYHEHNEAARAAALVRQMQDGTSVAVVSDAGTPAINDPGAVLVRAAIDAGIRVVPVPGPAAFVSAVVASGLPTDSIFFGGFLPSKKGDRRRRLEELHSVPATLVFYETPHRIAASLADCLHVLGDRPAAAARELTKLHEEFVRGTLSSLATHFSDANSRGEFVLVIDREKDAPEQVAPGRSLTERIGELEAEGVDHKTALKRAAKEFGMTRSEAYREWQSAKDNR